MSNLPIFEIHRPIVKWACRHRYFGHRKREMTPEQKAAQRIAVLILRAAKVEPWRGGIDASH